MEKENVIQKIQKLLKLQYGAESIGSTGEAFQAAKMVQKLLMEYNLSMGDIDTSDGQDTMKMDKSIDMSSGSKFGNHWKFQLLGVIAQNNLCQAYKRMDGKMFVVGTEDNVAIVKEFYDYLVKVFLRLGKKHLEKMELEAGLVYGITVLPENIRTKYMRSYLEGVSFGLQENYDSLKPTSAETALAVCHKEAIEDYINENFQWSEKKTRKRTRHVYGDAYDLGHADGKSVNLNRQIAQKVTEGSLF